MNDSFLACTACADSSWIMIISRTTILSGPFQHSPVSSVQPALASVPAGQEETATQSKALRDSNPRWWMQVSSIIFRKIYHARKEEDFIRCRVMEFGSLVYSNLENKWILWCSDQRYNSVFAFSNLLVGEMLRRIGMFCCPQFAVPRCAGERWPGGRDSQSSPGCSNHHTTSPGYAKTWLFCLYSQLDKAGKA